MSLDDSAPVAGKKVPKLEKAIGEKLFDLVTFKLDYKIEEPNPKPLTEGIKMVA